MEIENEYLYFIDTFGCDLIIRNGMFKYHVYLKLKTMEYYLKDMTPEDILRDICKRNRLNFKQYLKEYKEYLKSAKFENINDKIKNG